MILDVLANAHRYLALHQGFSRVFDFLGRPDLRELPEDSYEIDGERIYAMVAREPGCKKEDSLLEIHKKYIDIQLVLAGIDTMGWRPKSLCKKPTGGYDPETDLQFYTDKPEVWLPTQSGSFVIFYPKDAHMPLISSGQIHKIVVKIAVNQT